MMDLNRIWEHWTEQKVVIIVFPHQSIPLLVCFDFRTYKDFWRRPVSHKKCDAIQHVFNVANGTCDFILRMVL